MSVSMWFKFDEDSWPASYLGWGGLLAELRTSEWGGNNGNYKNHGIGAQVFLLDTLVYFRTVKPQGGVRDAKAPCIGGGWHHVTATLSSGPLEHAVQRIYVDGIEGTPDTNNPQILHREFLYDLSTIGAEPSGPLGSPRVPREPYKGHIDNFGLWATVGLTADQVQVLYTMDSGGIAAPSPFSLVVNQPEYFDLSSESQTLAYQGTYRLDPDKGMVNNRGIYVETVNVPSRFIAWSTSAWKVAAFATLDAVRGTRGDFTSLLASQDGYVAEFPQYTTRQCSHMVTEASCDGRPAIFHGECSKNGATDYRMCNEVRCPTAVLLSGEIYIFHREGKKPKCLDESRTGHLSMVFTLT